MHVSLISDTLEPACDVAPDVKNAIKTVTETEVTYTCEPNHKFADNTTERNYTCLCAQLAIMEACIREHINLTITTAFILFIFSSHMGNTQQIVASCEIALQQKHLPWRTTKQFGEC